MNTRGMPPIFTWYWYATSRGVQCSRDAARAYSLHILVIGCPTQILIGRYARYAALKQTCSSWPNSFSYNVCDNLYYFTRSIGTNLTTAKSAIISPPTGNHHASIYSTSEHASWLRLRFQMQSWSPRIELSSPRKYIHTYICWNIRYTFDITMRPNVWSIDGHVNHGGGIYAIIIHVYHVDTHRNHRTRHWNPDLTLSRASKY